MLWLSRISALIFHKPLDLVVRHFENRLFELAMAVIFFGNSLMLAISPGSMQAGGMIYLSATFNVWTLTAIFFIVGASRIVALALNGHWLPYGAYVRAVGAAVGAIMWLQVDAALITFGVRESAAIPVETVTYGVLAIFEAISMYRALLGAKRNGRRASDKGNLGVDNRQHTVVAFYPASELDRVRSGDDLAFATGDQGPARSAVGRL